MSRKIIAVAGLSALALAASGCSGGSDAEADSPVDITKLRAEFKERFGTPDNEAPWYRHITAISWANGQLEVTTDLSPEEYEGSDELRGAICGEPLKLAFELAKPRTIQLSATVFGPGGVGMGYCG